MAWSPGRAKSPASANRGSFAWKNKAIIRLIYSKAVTLQPLFSLGVSLNDWITFLFPMQDVKQVILLLFAHPTDFRDSQKPCEDIFSFIDDF